MREEENKLSEEGSTVAPEALVGPQSASGPTDNISGDQLVHTLRTNKRFVTLGEAVEARKKKKATVQQSLQLRDEPTDDSDVDQIPPVLKELRGIATDSDNLGAFGSGLPPTGPSPDAEGAEGYTLIRFCSGQGWLGEDSNEKAPLESLNTFALSPDRKLLEKESDEAVSRKAKEALGMG